MFNPYFNKKVGEYIADRRVELGMPQYKLAKKLGFSAQFLGRVEKGNARIPEASLKKAVKILKLSRSKIADMAANEAFDYCAWLLK